MSESPNRDPWISPPPPLKTSDPGSFARSTIVQRKPQIIRQVLADNDYPPEITAALEVFRHEIAAKPMQPLVEKADDVEDWNRELQRYAGRSWLEVPWYFAEVFFYRKLLEAVDYLQPGPWQNHDPFALQKQRQIEQAVDQFAASWPQMQDVEPGLTFEVLLHSSLWGNRADLSNFTVRELAHGGLATRSQRQHILIDHTVQVHELLAAGVEQVDFVCDNVGLDLLFDLALADFLLDQGWAQPIVLHLKDRPFFVSDAMPKDVAVTLDVLSTIPDPATQSLAQRLIDHQARGRLIQRCHPFWTSYFMFREFPPELSSTLAASDLVVLKGDVNYRRLLDDRHWPYDTPMEAIAGYFPAPFVVLRTLKGEIMVGLRPGQEKQLAAEEPDWLINGKRGVIQLVLGKR
jgi:uncharacterized protein with ATP-grasp and redox domains